MLVEVEEDPDICQDEWDQTLVQVWHIHAVFRTVSVFGIRIQMSKNRLKKPKFTVTDFTDENRKML